MSLFSQAIDASMPIRNTQASEDENQSAEVILMQQRKANLESVEVGKTVGGVEQGLPPELTRN